MMEVDGSEQIFEVPGHSEPLRVSGGTSTPLDGQSPKLFKCSKCNFTSKLHIALKKHLKTHEPSDAVHRANDSKPVNGYRPEVIVLDDLEEAISDDPLTDPLAPSDTHESKMNIDGLTAGTFDQLLEQNNVLYGCSFCDLSFLTLKDRALHATVCRNQDQLQIPEETVATEFLVNSEMNAGASSPSNHRRVARRRIGQKRKCPHCPKEIRDGQSFREHIRIHTGEKPYQCPLCSYACVKEFNLKIHMSYHKDGIIYQCDECDYKASNSKTLAWHKKSHVLPVPFRILGSQSLTNNGNLGHELSSSPSIQAGPSAQNISRSLKRNSSVLSNNNQRNQPRIQGCLNVQPMKSTLSDLNNSQQIPEITLDDDDDGKSPTDLEDNVEDQSDDNQSELRIVNVRSIGNTPIAAPSSSTLDESKKIIYHACGICGSRYRVLAALRSHMKVHSNDKPFKCGQCDYATKYKHSLQIHERSHEKPQTYSCAVCSFVGKTIESVALHMKIHKTKSFQCSVCKRYSSNKQVIAKCEWGHMYEDIIYPITSPATAVTMP